MTGRALLALALGTGVNTALFSIVNTVLLQPLPFPQADELVQVWRTELPRLQYGSASYPRYVDWRARNRVFVETGAWAPAGLTLTGCEAPERLAGRLSVGLVLQRGGAAGCRAGTSSMTRIAPAATRSSSSASSCWHRRFGGAPSVLGSRS